MKYTFLGRTGMTVSRLCLGCMSYGDPVWRPWVLDEAASRPFFKSAIASGINFFDTADMYSLGISEEVTGRALKEFARLEECVVATKVFNAMSDRPNMSGLSRKHIVQGCEASLTRIGLRRERHGEGLGQVADGEVQRSRNGGIIRWVDCAAVAAGVIHRNRLGGRPTQDNLDGGRAVALYDRVIRHREPHGRLGVVIDMFSIAELDEPRVAFVPCTLLKVRLSEVFGPALPSLIKGR